jgi:hypothetical protein
MERSSFSEAFPTETLSIRTYSKKKRTPENPHIFRSSFFICMIKYNKTALKAGGLRHDTVPEEKSDAWRQQ